MTFATKCLRDARVGLLFIALAGCVGSPVPQSGNANVDGGSSQDGGSLQDSATAIVAGNAHTCALVSGGVQCWGYNYSGQLGTNGRQNNSVPSGVIGLGPATGVTAIAAGAAHTCALVSGGVRCWGDNTEGQLGVNSLKSHVPVQVAGLGPSSEVAAIAAGGAHTCALQNGGVLCWGSNVWGELGNNSWANSRRPVPVTGLAPPNSVTAIAAGSDQTCAVANGRVLCWGWNQFGDLGNDSTVQSNTPVAVVGLGSASITGIAGGGGFTCAFGNGGVQCWGGEGGYGDLGNNSQGHSLVPVQVTGLGPTSRVSSMGLGWQHACAVNLGGVQCWGNNDTGQLGNNSTAISRMPVAVLGVPQSDATAVAAGLHHTCALVNNAVWCWGYNEFGQLGNNSTDASYLPVPVAAWSR